MAAERRVGSSGARTGFRPYGGSGVRGLLVWALIGVWFTSVAETLNMTIFKSPKHVLLNTDVSLECKVTGFGTTTLDLSNVGVQWLFGPQKKDIYTFNAGKSTSKRHGIKISETELQKGDASLHLSNVQLDEEGQYTCIVFVTPDKAEKSSQMMVLAQPKVHLSTQHITILNGAEKSVRCDATGFYPQQHEIFWEKISTEKTERLGGDICTEAAVSNNDGTFSVSSRMRIEPTLDDDGKTYKCVVRHQSLPDERSLELKVSVKEPEEYSAAGAIAGVIIAAIILCLLVVTGLLAYFLRFRKVPPEITGCSGHQIFRHFETEVVTWKVSPFRPREITIVLYIKRKHVDNKCQLLKWSSKDQIENHKQDVSTNGMDCNETRILMHSDEENASFRPLVSEFETNTQNISSVKVIVNMYPDISQDDGAELIIEVQHPALKWPITKTLTLDVKGVPPKVLNILAPPRIIQNEPVALTCSITGFKPRPLSITWQQKRRNSDLEEIVRLEDNRTIIPDDKRKNSMQKHYINEMEHEDKTYSITSVLVTVPDILQDQHCQYFCTIQHHCTNSKEEREMTLFVTAPPKLDTIKCEAEKIIEEVPMTLSCQISAFYPGDITVTWLQNGSKEVEEFQVGDAMIGQDGLCHLTSNIKIVPTRAHAMKYTCRVAHVSLAVPVETDWVAGEVISLPKLTVIKADPALPEVGVPLTLSCKAYGFYPEGNQIFWFKEFDKIEDVSKEGINTGKSELDTVSGLYSRSSQWKFKPTAGDHRKEFKMQILHSDTSSKPVTASYILKLKGIPYVEDIKCEPQTAAYGTELVLSCKVSNFIAKNIQTMWMKRGNQISEGVKIVGPELDENGCLQLLSCLHVKPTAQDFGESFSFQVENSNLNKPIQKQTVLTLPALSPSLSVIRSDPKLLKVDQPATFSVSLTGYVPAKFQVKWFKDGKLCQNVKENIPEIADDGLFSSVTSLTFVTSKKDHESTIRCEVLHEETKKVQEKDFKLLLKDCAEEEGDTSRVDDEDESEEISNIKCHTKDPKVGQPVTLSCDVKRYALEEAQIIWYRDAYPFDEKQFTANTPFENGSGFTTALTYTPKEKEKNEIQVQIEIDFQVYIRHFNLILS
ncbi:uncharacterized protein LOC127577613 isoform X3 [Pristis pectinata]|uniref:uncharacterized protein LOC127577613 isoform X2 n=1 Tax=Pristis pectinata TaxID=685728 RepID=UPI00223CE693|nr:uncharacterized protein LOC127577613 isoform X2 [Pristis pectinata]XP_051884867.1 uncharacterized protein LOC127577613 isoform X3 [Pristis pectinata]